MSEPPKISARRAISIRVGAAPFLLGIPLGVLAIHHATGNPLPTDLLLFVVGAAGAWEFVRLLRGSDRETVPWVGILASGLIAGVGLFAPFDAALRSELRALFVMAAFLALLGIHLYDVRPRAVERIAYSMLPVLYVGLLLTWVRDVGDGPELPGTLAWIVLAAKASDVGGWLIGMPFGRHKLVPTVSPGKSWEGLAGGLFLSAVVGVWGPGLLGLEAAAWSVPKRAVFGLVLGLASVLAGLTQSGWKRRFGVKDSSMLLPEIGGVLDLIDSLLLAGPVAWAWFRLGL